MADLIRSQEAILKTLNCRVAQLKLEPKLIRPKASAAAIVPGADLYVPLEGLIDFAKEKARLEKERELIRQDADRLSKKLANGDFLNHAPKEEIAKAQDRFKESQERLKHLEENINVLN
jgi:valyl-tRNA synthetase